MNRRLLPALVIPALVLAALALVGCTGKDAVDRNAGGQFRFVSGTELGTTYTPADRTKPGDFTADKLDGGTMKLSQTAGKVVVLNFWAQWCPPCTIETPQFDSVYRQYKSKGVAFVGIDTKDTRSKAKGWVQDTDISYPMVFDEKGEVPVRLGKIPALSLPFTVLLDKHGRVAAVYLEQLEPKDLEPVLDRLLAEA